MGPTKGGGWGTGVLHITQGTRPPSRVHAIRFTLGVRRLALLLLGARPPHRARQHPRGCPNIEIRGLTSDVRHAPALQILIERRGEVEHVAHARDAADVPRTDVLIEHPGVAEHGLHARDAADVPRTDVLIERAGPEIHPAHVRDAADVPRTDVLIERVGAAEHVAHARDAADVPRTDVLIERVGSVEHVAHVRDAAGACGRQGRVIPCINKCVDLSFRSLGVCDPSHFACIT